MMRRIPVVAASAPQRPRAVVRQLGRATVRRGGATAPGSRSPEPPRRARRPRGSRSSREVAELGRERRPEQRPGPGDRGEVVAEDDPAVRRHEIASVVEPDGRRGAAVVERQHSGREELRVEPVGDQVQVQTAATQQDAPAETGSPRARTRSSRTTPPRPAATSEPDESAHGPHDARILGRVARRIRRALCSAAITNPDFDHGGAMRYDTMREGVREVQRRPDAGRSEGRSWSTVRGRSSGFDGGDGALDRLDRRRRRRARRRRADPARRHVSCPRAGQRRPR